MIHQVEIAPERLAAFLAAMAIDVAGSRTEPGCLRFDLLRVDANKARPERGPWHTMTRRDTP